MEKLQIELSIVVSIVELILEFLMEMLLFEFLVVLVYFSDGMNSGLRQSTNENQSIFQTRFGS